LEWVAPAADAPVATAVDEPEPTEEADQLPWAAMVGSDPMAPVQALPPVADLSPVIDALVTADAAWVPSGTSATVPLREMTPAVNVGVPEQRYHARSTVPFGVVAAPALGGQQAKVVLALERFLRQVQLRQLELRAATVA
jgi:hypothetical protein